MAFCDHSGHGHCFRFDKLSLAASQTSSRWCSKESTSLVAIIDFFFSILLVKHCSCESSCFPLLLQRNSDFRMAGLNKEKCCVIRSGSECTQRKNTGGLKDGKELTHRSSKQVINSVHPASSCFPPSWNHEVSKFRDTKKDELILYTQKKKSQNPEGCWCRWRQCPSSSSWCYASREFSNFHEMQNREFTKPL